MSKHWGYACTSHDPMLVSEHWFNHGEQTLTALFKAMRAGHWPINEITEYPEQVVHRGYGTRAPAMWLLEHPHCEVVLHNEYGDTAPIEPAEATSPPAPTRRDRRVPEWDADPKVWAEFLRQQIEDPLPYLYAPQKPKVAHKPRPRPALYQGHGAMNTWCSAFVPAGAVLSENPCELPLCKTCFKEKP